MITDEKLLILYAASHLVDGRKRSLCVFPRDVQAMIERIRIAEGKPVGWPIPKEADTA